jgi:hypothetical protein
VVLTGSLAVLGLHVPTWVSGASPTPRGDRSSEGDSGDSQLQRTTTGARPVRFTNASPATEFPGLGSSETYGATTYFWTPGEPVLAVGPNDILQTVNEAAAVYDKTGKKLAEFDFGTFWPGGTVNNPVQCTDPRALYLASVDRFAISCSSASMLFAISQTSDPTGAWYKYAAPNSSFLDQDKIEATADKFLIAGNTSTNEQIYVYNLSDVVNGVANPARVLKTAKKSNIYEAAAEQTATSAAYFVSSYPGNQLYLATINGTPAGNNVTLTETLIKSTDYPAPQEPAVPGGHIGGGVLDGRVYDAVYETETSDNKPVIQYSSARECGTRVCVTSSRIDLSGAKPVLAYDQLVGEPGYDDSYGAVGLDGAGNVFEAFTQTNSGQTPSAALAGPGFVVTLQPSAAGTNACSPPNNPPCDERWGDYFGTAIDPSDPTSVWVTATYQGTSGGYGYGTVIARVSTTTFALPTVTTGSASKITAGGATLSGTVDPNGVATTSHIDYGLTSGYDSSTVETSAGSGSSAVPVSAKLTGLQENSVYHYRVVATTVTGSSVGPDKTFRIAGPKITSVTFTGTAAAPTVTITGHNFGTEPTGSPAGCGATGDNFGTSLWFDEITASWAAGEGGDCIALLVNSYSPTRIVYQFGSFYDTNGLAPANSGDQYQVTVMGNTFNGTVTYS